MNSIFQIRRFNQQASWRLHTLALYVVFQLELNGCWTETRYNSWVFKNLITLNSVHNYILKNLGELSSAIRKETSLKFGLYYSLFEWFNRLYINDKLHIFLEQNYVNRKMRPEQTELINEYLPEILWSDGDWEAPAKYWKAEEFIAWWVSLKKFVGK